MWIVFEELRQRWQQGHVAELRRGLWNNRVRLATYIRERRKKRSDGKDCGGVNRMNVHCSGSGEALFVNVIWNMDDELCEILEGKCIIIFRILELRIFFALRSFFIIFLPRAAFYLFEQSFP